MAIPIIEGIVQIIKNLISFCDKTSDNLNAEKYSIGVNKLNSSVDDTYAGIREIIINDKSLSAEKKIEKLDKLAQSQISARQSCENAVKGNRDNVAKFISEVVLALATCGLSYVPKLVREIKKNKSIVAEINQHKNLSIDDGKNILIEEK